MKNDACENVSICTNDSGDTIVYIRPHTCAAPFLYKSSAVSQDDDLNGPVRHDRDKCSPGGGQSISQTAVQAAVIFGSSF